VQRLNADGRFATHYYVKLRKLMIGRGVSATRIQPMSEPTPSVPVQLGFLTVFQEGAGYLGGYFITNSWGRPLEFRLSTAVQPNRVQQILYGPTLGEYLHADLIGKTLVEKSSTPIRLLITNARQALAIRRHVNVPVIAVTPRDETEIITSPNESIVVLPDVHRSARVFYNGGYAGEAEAIREILSRIDSALDLNEPFARIREAMAEARKMGATSRAA
jgi:hypothetical protein